jgi:hypothetical protein
MSPARLGRLLRSGFGLAASRSVLAALHPSAPKGLPNQPLLCFLHSWARSFLCPLYVS